MERKILGAAVWLWMHSPLHRDAPLHTLPDLLLPVIKHRQYVVATEQGRPVFFISQAWLSPEAEARYLTQPAITCLSRTGTAATGCGSVTGLPLWTHSGYEPSCPAGYFSPSVLAFAVPPWAADRVTLTADGRIENSGSISAKTDVHLATTRELHNEWFCLCGAGYADTE